MLTNCPECNREVSDKAIACPICGYPMGKPDVKNSSPIADAEPSTIVFENQDQAIPSSMHSKEYSKERLIVKSIIFIIISVYVCIFAYNVLQHKSEEGLTNTVNYPQQVAIEQKENSNVVNYADSTTPTDDRWFIVSNYTDKCTVDEGPSKMIKSFKTLGQPYQVVEDVVESGKPMQVRLLLNDGIESGQIVYYRGETLCQEQLKKKQQTNNTELNRYK